MIIPDAAKHFFEAHIQKTDSCWLWTGSKTSFGYGQMSFGPHDGSRRTWPAHKVSWMLHKGDIPDGLFVCHQCDNPPCVNPDHLFLGTAGDNTRDCISKGRDRGPVAANREATHCIRGHEFTPENTWVNPKIGGRQCRMCFSLRMREHHQRSGRTKTPLLPTSEEALIFCKIFHRKPVTPWSKKEVEAFKALRPFDQEELDMVARYYFANWPPFRNKNILRHDLQTFLNNYQSECDRARAWCQAHPPKTAYVPRKIVQMPVQPEQQLTEAERAQAEADFLKLMGRAPRLSL